jgi:Tol biopolymer transport system component
VPSLTLLRSPQVGLRILGRLGSLLLLALAVPFVGVADLGAAASGEYNIDIVAIDLAGRQTNLTRDYPAIDVAPAVARDGRIAFLSDRGGAPDIFVMDANGRIARRLTNAEQDHSGIALAEDLEWSQAAWSPDGRHVAFDGKYLAAGATCEQHCSNWQVLSIRADGSGLSPVARPARAPAWSPDGKRLAFRDHVDAYYASNGVGIAHLDGSPTASAAAANGQSSARPVWSSNGRRLAFAASGWIYTVGRDGARRRRIAVGSDPSWSPDGRRLAFVDDCRLFTIDAAGGHRRRVSSTREVVIAAAWSPRTNTIAYIASARAVRCSALPPSLRVETVNADLKHVHVLARERPATLIWGDPVWTPNGKRILVSVEAH